MPEAGRRDHRYRRLSGRDPAEAHRAATPLELLYDLTFVLAFGTAADALARYLAVGSWGAALIGFSLALLAVAWAWLNFSWFASAYNTDDWVFRIATMVQMAGVIVVALGIDDMFASLDRAAPPDFHVMVIGYVVMRVSAIFLWSLVARSDPVRRPAAAKYIWTIAVAQIGWVVVAFSGLRLSWFLLACAAVFAVELTGPVLAENRSPTPWNARHIAERHGLLVLITLGEGLVGTVAAVNALVHTEHGWTFDAALLLLSGVALALGMWWMYFAVPWGEVLEAHRERAYLWSAGHILLFGAVAAVGAGLHVAAYFLEGVATVGTLGAVTTTLVPVALYILVLYALYSAFLRDVDPLQLVLLAATAIVLIGSAVCAWLGVNVVVCLVLLTLAPIVTIVGFETIGHRHLAEAEARERNG